MDSLISRLDHAINGEKNAVCVFDIDSTIFNVSPRNQDIFDLFCSIYSSQHPILHKLSSNIRLKYTDWGLEPYISTIQNLSAPLESRSELKNLARSFWKKHFFAGTFLHSDEPYKGVERFIHWLHQKGAQILYLTGRDDHRMRQGTLLQLKHWNLPLENDNDLITKPHKGLIDGNYKSSELKKIFNLFPDHPLFFFDNEPSVFEHCTFPSQPHYTPVFIESTHSSRSQVKDSWLKLDVRNYSQLLQDLQK